MTYFRVTSMRRSRAGLLLRLLASVVLLAAAPIAYAQPCFGTPQRGGVAFEHSSASFSVANGVSAAYAGSHFSVGAVAQARDRGAQISAQEGGLRLALQFPAGPVKLCPALRFGFSNESWTPRPGTKLNTKRGTAGGGIGVGIEQPVVGGFSLIPYATIHYDFNVYYLGLSTPSGGNEVSGDSLSLVDIEYGIAGRYKFFYAGFAGQRNSDSKSKRPYQTRIMVGLTLSGGTKPRASRPAKSKRAERATH